MPNDEEVDLSIKVDAAIKLATAALELVHNITVRVTGGGVDFVDAARGFLDHEVVDDLPRETFLRERASRQFTAQILMQLAKDFGQT